jgi:hypothetical protein
MIFGNVEDCFSALVNCKCLLRTDELLLQSKWADLFIRLCDVWHGEPTEEDINRIYTRKPDPPFKSVEFGDGSSGKVWSTFSPDQIDINVFSETGKRYIKKQVHAICSRCVVWPAYEDLLLLHTYISPIIVTFLIFYDSCTTGSCSICERYCKDYRGNAICSKRGIRR